MSTRVPVPKDLMQRIRQGRRFLLTSHTNPDGDAIGSELGLARLLRQLGKSATIWNHDAAPTVYAPLPGVDRVRVGPLAPPGFPSDFDTVILLECPALERTGLEEQLRGIEVINIDHHLGNQLYGKLNWVDTSAPAVGEMVFRLAQEHRLAIDPEAATCLYLTLVTDTGGFRYSNSTPRAFEAAGSLVAVGASPELVALWLHESQPVAAIRLLGEMLGSLELHSGDRIATVSLTPAMYERARGRREDSEGLIDYVRTIGGVSMVALFRVLDGGKVKVSLRSRGELDIERVARRNGGGGHRNAAGCTVEGEMGAVRAEIVRQLTELLEEPKG